MSNSCLGLIGSTSVTVDELYPNQQSSSSSSNHTLNVDSPALDLQYREPPLNINIKCKHVAAAVSGLTSFLLLVSGAYIAAETPEKLLGTPLLAAGLGACLSRVILTLTGSASKVPSGISLLVDVTAGLALGGMGIIFGKAWQEHADQAHAPAPAPWN